MASAKGARYDDGHVRVTDSTVQVGDSAYAIRNISSVKMVRENLDLLSLVVSYIFNQSPYYLLMITTNAGEVRLLRSKDLDNLSLIRDVISMAMSQYR